MAWTRSHIVGLRLAGAGAAAIALHMSNTSSNASEQPRSFVEPKDERVVKRVIFVRHGQGYHNANADGLSIFDPSLTERGVAEAQSVFTKDLATFQPQVAFVSPLWRTLQTCTHAFFARADAYTCPIYAMEDAREHNNLNACNHRRAIGDEHRRTFPEVSFASVDTAGPPPASEWNTSGYKASVGMPRERAARALATLAARPESQVVVFTHGTFVRCVIAEVLQLSPHFFGECPSTGTPTELLLIETPSGARYWEIAKGAAVVHSIAAGASTQRAPLTDRAVH